MRGQRRDGEPPTQVPRGSLYAALGPEIAEELIREAYADIPAFKRRAQINGRVVLAGTGIPYAKVTAGALETTADADGCFRLDMPDGQYTIRGGEPGRCPGTARIVVKDGKAETL